MPESEQLELAPFAQPAQLALPLHLPVQASPAMEKKLEAYFLEHAARAAATKH